MRENFGEVPQKGQGSKVMFIQLTFDCYLLGGLFRDRTEHGTDLASGSVKDRKVTRCRIPREKQLCGLPGDRLFPVEFDLGVDPAKLHGKLLF